MIEPEDVPRRIFASVTQDEFYACASKGRRDGLDLGQVLARLVRAYIQDDVSIKED
jgi:hypothetical protein